MLTVNGYKLTVLTTVGELELFWVFGDRDFTQEHVVKTTKVTIESIFDEEDKQDGLEC